MTKSLKSSCAVFFFNFKFVSNVSWPTFNEHKNNPAATESTTWTSFPNRIGDHMSMNLQAQLNSCQTLIFAQNVNLHMVSNKLQTFLQGGSTLLTMFQQTNGLRKPKRRHSSQSQTERIITEEKKTQKMTQFAGSFEK